MAPQLLTRKQVLLQVNEIFEEKLVQHLGFEAVPYFNKSTIEKLPGFVPLQLPQLFDLVQVGELGGTGLYSTMEFEQDSLGESYQLTAEDLREFMGTLQESFREQAQRSSSAGDLVLGQIYSEFCEILPKFYAVNCNTGRRILWLA